MVCSDRGPGEVDDRVLATVSERSERTRPQRSLPAGLDARRVDVGGATLSWAGATDVGRVRSVNEDALLIEPPMFVVADGMGGHEAGEVASALTVARLRRMPAQGPVTTEAVAAELRTINSLLVGASADPSSTMGTTGVGLVMVTHGGMHSWLIFNVGDSRAYCLEGGELRQISRDHSYVQELIDAGELDHDDRGGHPHRNVVTRALGADEELEADYWIRPLQPAERFLLCSDGLTGEVDDVDLTAILAAGEPAAQTVATLVDRALAGGGRDNVTAVVVDVISVLGWDDATTGERPRAAGADVATVEADEVDADTFDRTLPHGPPVPLTDPPEVGRGDLIVHVPQVRDDAAPPPGGAPGQPGPPHALIGPMPSHLASPPDPRRRTTGALAPPPAPAVVDHDTEESPDGR